MIFSKRFKNNPNRSMNHTRIVAIIPSRLESSRLPRKALTDICGLPMIVHVFKRCEFAKSLDELFVATDSDEICQIVEQHGGKVLMTSSHHKNGTERIYEGLQKLKMTNVDHIISLQGDEPEINPEDIKNLYNNMIKNNSDMGTLAAEIKEDSMLYNKNIVKVKTQEKLKNNNFVLAIDFSRDNFSKQSLNVYHHIGIYCYKTSTLKKFINLKQTKNEIKSRLEQLRAMDNNININVALAKSSPIGVDTKEDYVAFKKIMEYKS